MTCPAQCLLTNMHKFSLPHQNKILDERILEVPVKLDILIQQHVLQTAATRVTPHADRHRRVEAETNERVEIVAGEISHL